MNSIPSINVTTTPNTSFKGNLERIAYIAKESYSGFTKYTDNKQAPTILNKIKFAFRTTIDNMPFATFKRSRPTLNDTILSRDVSGDVYKSIDRVTDLPCTCYGRRDPKIRKTVKKVFDEKGRYVRTEHEYFNRYTVITDSKGHWVIIDTNNDEPMVKLGRFYNTNQVLSFIKENWNFEKNILEPKFFAEDTAKIAAQ